MFTDIPAENYQTLRDDQNLSLRIFNDKKFSIDENGNFNHTWRTDVVFYSNVLPLALLTFDFAVNKLRVPLRHLGFLAVFSAVYLICTYVG